MSKGVKTNIERSRRDVVVVVVVVVPQHIHLELSAAIDASQVDCR